MSSLLTSDPSQLPGGSLGISGSEAANKKQDSVRIIELQKYEVKISIVIRIKFLETKGVNPNCYPEIEAGLLSKDDSWLEHGEPIRVTRKAQPSHYLDSGDRDRVENWDSTRTNRFRQVIVNLKDLRQQ